MAQTPYDLQNRNPSQVNMEETENLEEESTPSPHPGSSEPDPTSQVKTVINMKDFIEVNMDEKFNLLMCAINKMNTNFHLKFEELQNSNNITTQSLTKRLETYETNYENLHTAMNDEHDGILPRMRDAEASVTDLTTRIENLEEAHVVLPDQIALLSGTAQVHDRQVTTPHHKVTDLPARSMSKNIIISGITGDNKEEDCTQNVLEFFIEKLQFEIDIKDIEDTHHLGTKIPGKLRRIIAKLAPHVQKKVFDFTKNLKGLKNELNEFYRVWPQFPEPIDTERQEKQQKVAQVRKFNQNVEDETKKIKIEFKKGTLHLNGKPQRKHIIPPTVTQLLNVSSDLQAKLDKVAPVHSNQIKDKYSSFQGFALRVNNITDICHAYLRIKQLNPEADHIMLAYTIKEHSGHHDHGEHKAAGHMLQILQDRNLSNVAVFVVRVYGGIPLGQKRFLHIEKSTREALNNLLEK